MKKHAGGPCSGHTGRAWPFDHSSLSVANGAK